MAAVRVAVGIIPKKNKILLCQRKPSDRYGLKWEFPGGKAFEYEPIEEALCRELNEELGIAVRALRTVHSSINKYEDGGEYAVTYFVVDEYSGHVVNMAFHNLAWVTTDALTAYDILEGNKEIMQMIVDGAVAITDEDDEADELDEEAA
ncbi:MAG TPA: NUDIX domain-containing protein [Candidatus Kapabacteria bacterium]|nr:NUDIX domain-containing protein [Candidatus Kapabacteria bacterium]